MTPSILENVQIYLLSQNLTRYKNCSNIYASSFITFFTYMLRKNVIPLWKELFVTFKMAPNIKKHSLYFASNRRLYKGHSCILKFSEANCHTRFGTCVDIVPYLCKFETKWHQVLDASLRYIDTIACRNFFYIILFQSRVNRHVSDVINFMINVILRYLLVMQ